MKIGRNEPCPCGSGKKYKTCCLDKDSPAEFLTANDLNTGTLLDDYQILFKSIAFYGQSLQGFGDDKKELNSARSDFERRFKPGTPEGVSDGLFMSWFYFDFRFGPRNKTIAERYIDEGFLKKLADPGLDIIQDMAMSYCAFYEILSVDEERISVQELVTQEKFEIVRIDDTYEQDARVGDIWYTRLVGPDYEEVYCFIAPFIFLPESKKFFEKMLKKQLGTFSDLVGDQGKSMDSRLKFTLSCKNAVVFWAQYFIEAGPSESAEVPLKMPVLVNTDRDPMHFCKVYFKVRDEKKTREKLNGLPNFEKGEKDTWAWFKKEKRKTLGERTMAATIQLKDDWLIAEANSLKRALKLKRLFVKELTDAVVYDRIDAKSPEAMPKPTVEEMRKFEEEQKRIHEHPEVRALLRRKKYDYYHKSWIRQKIPALGGITPLEAAKTQKGREALKELFKKMERMETASAHITGVKMDFTKLKEKLGTA